jgi:hypothetical protein
MVKSEPYYVEDGIDQGEVWSPILWHLTTSKIIMIKALYKFLEECQHIY